MTTEREEVEALRSEAVAALAERERDAERQLLALAMARQLFDKALPKFNWGASALDAETIRILNEAPSVVRAAIDNAIAASGGEGGR